MTDQQQTEKPSDMERFAALCMPEPNSGCWLWLGNVRGRGYGTFKMKGAAIPAHRASVILYRGDFDRSLFVCHKCDVPGCVNPDHLFLGTPGDNHRDMVAKSRAAWSHGEFRGEGNPFNKLTASAVADIKLALTAVPTPEIYAMARAYGVSPANIHSIRNGETWADVEAASGPVVNLPPPPGKLCGYCQQYKPLSQFYVMKTGKRAGQLVAHCTPCQSRKKKERRNAI